MPDATKSRTVVSGRLCHGFVIIGSSGGADRQIFHEPQPYRSMFDSQPTNTFCHEQVKVISP